MLLKRARYACLSILRVGGFKSFARIDIYTVFLTTCPPPALNTPCAAVQGGWKAIVGSQQDHGCALRPLIGDERL